MIIYTTILSKFDKGLYIKKMVGVPQAGVADQDVCAC